MHDMLSAFHLVRYFELREKERQPYREFPRLPRFSLSRWLKAKLRADKQQD